MTESNVVTTAERKPPIVVLRERLVERRSELKAALTDIDPDHFIRALITSAQVNPDIQACTFQSLWLACMRACRDQLLPDGREGAIVPYKSNAQWIPMYQGLLKRFRQSGQCKWIGANVVRKGETFEHWVDHTGEHFRHVPVGDHNEPVEKVYAAALTKDGAFYIAVMSATEIDKIRKVSRATRDDAPWKMWTEEMMKKTALRRLSKMLPAGREFFDEDDDDNGPPPQQVTEPTPITTLQRSPGALAALDQFAGETEQEPETETRAGTEPATKEPETTETAADPLDVSVAYDRGVAARTEGFARKAVPPEYRAKDATLACDAWLAGWDGKRFVDPDTGEVREAPAAT